MAQPPFPSTAEPEKEGNVSGQVYVGDYTVLVHAEHGAVVYLSPPDGTPVPRQRPSPVLLRPRLFPGLLDRAEEVEAATAGIRTGLPVVIYGQAGVGKTTLLRHLSYLPEAAIPPDGIIYISARNHLLEDLSQSLFDAFYLCDVPLKCTTTQIQKGLKNRKALVLLDDFDSAQENVQGLLGYAPGCTFVLASRERALSMEAHEVPLAGLPADDAVELLERELGRPFAPDEPANARILSKALGYHPLRIQQAAALVRQENRTLAELARIVLTIAPDKELTEQTLIPLPEYERRVLGSLAALDGSSIHSQHLVALTGLPNAREILDSLVMRGLVEDKASGYRLTGDLGDTLNAAWDLTPWKEHAMSYFVTWTEQNRQVTGRVLDVAESVVRLLDWGVGQGRWPDVLRLGRAVEGSLCLGARWAIWTKVLEWVLQAARTLKDRSAEAWALHQLGARALCLSDSTAAVELLKQSLALRQQLGEEKAAQLTRHNLNIIGGPAAVDDDASDKTEGRALGHPLSPLLTVVPLLVIALLVAGVLLWYFWLRQGSDAGVAQSPAISTPVTNPQSLLPEILSFSADPASAAAGSETRLCYQVSNATRVQIEPQIGEVTPGETNCVQVLPQTTTVYTLIATNASGQQARKEITVMVANQEPVVSESPAPEPAPSAPAEDKPAASGPVRIVNFGASDSKIEAGGQTQICYEVSNASSVRIDQGMGEMIPVDRGCRSISPVATTTYTLTAVGGDGQTIRRAFTVSVGTPVRIARFSAEPQSVTAGGKVRLCYTVTNAASIVINPQVGLVRPGQGECVTVAPARNTTYTLVATAANGSTATQSVSVEVKRPAANPPQIISFSADPAVVEAGKNAKLCFRVANAVRVLLDPSVGAVDPDSTKCPKVSPKRTTVYTLTVIGPDGQTTTRQVTVQVKPKS